MVALCFASKVWFVGESHNEIGL